MRNFNSGLFFNCLWLATLSAGLCGQALAQDACVPSEPTPVGSEFQVSGTTLDSHMNSTVVAKPSGGFLVGWGADDRGDSLLYGRNFSLQGAATSAELNLMPTSGSRFYKMYGRPALLMGSNEEFQALWPGYFWTQGDNGTWYSHDGMVTRRYHTDGTTIGGYQPAAVNYAGNQSYAAIADVGSGNFVALWSGNGTGDDFGVFQRHFQANGDPQGDETRVNLTTTAGQGRPGVASRPGIGYVVVWGGNGPGDNRGIFMRAFNSFGGAQSGEILVNTTTAGTQDAPQIAMTRDGRFVVIWHGWADNGDAKVYGQRFDSNHLPVGDEFEVNSGIGYPQVNAVVAMMPDGGFVVATNGDGPGDDRGVFMRRFNEFGIGHANLIRVNTTVTGTQSYPGVAVAPGGQIMVTWQGNGVAGDFQIYGQVYDPPPRIFRAAFEPLNDPCPY
ncbi:MAG TPA: hypothetical protein VFN25_03700 [Dokdonella sp.]|uniref:hypothetical protein n=1 Tax=Dokdonella sp. TaxID=2291710 RepID=UPI002D811048|nr:hypothetical protein [Dokdonella sp.]HET9031991.1 hypothetical protein [Dokdonella sp.]